MFDIEKCPFLEIGNGIYIWIIVKSYSLIIGNGYSDRSQATDPFRSCKNRIFGDDDHPCSQDLDQAYFLMVHIFPHF